MNLGGEREFLVVSKSIQAVLLLVLSTWLWGCSAIVPERKTPSGGSRILEEDVTDDRASRPEREDEITPGGGESPGSVEVSPHTVPPEQRSRRRFKPLRDQTGAIKGWEPTTDGTRGREP
jgi:hypothetical protein